MFQAAASETGHATTVTWSELDDVLTRLSEARSLVEAVHMAAGNNDLPREATNAIQAVCSVADDRLNDVRDLVTAIMDNCK